MVAPAKKSVSPACKTYPPTQTLVSWLRQHWADLLILTALFTAAILLSYKGTTIINAAILDRQGMDVWFDADLPRVFSNMVARGSNHYRNKVHPLFPLIAYFPVKLLEKGLNLESIAAVRAVISTVAAIWLALLFSLLRVLGCCRADAILFSLLATVSASAVFWFIVPETYQFGSLSILVALGVAALTEQRQLSSLWYVGVSALTFSITITNWMAGILLTAVSYSKKEALQITINAFCLVVLLWSVQKRLFPSAGFFLLGIKGETEFVTLFDPIGPIHTFKAFIAHTLVMPTINLVENVAVASPWPVLSVQASVPGSASLWGAIAVVAWIVLLSLGIWGFFSYQRHTKLRIVLALTLLGQLLLHSIYGAETFLYSLHFLPLLILLAAFSTFTPARPIALLLVGVLLITAGTNNFIQLSKTIEIIDAGTSLGYETQQNFQNADHSLIDDITDAKDALI